MHVKEKGAMFQKIPKVLQNIVDHSEPLVRNKYLLLLNLKSIIICFYAPQWLFQCRTTQKFLLNSKYMVY